MPLNNDEKMPKQTQKEKLIDTRRLLWEVLDKITQEERVLIENPKNLDKEDLIVQLNEFDKTKDLLEQVIDNLDYLF